MTAGIPMTEETRTWIERYRRLDQKHRAVEININGILARPGRADDWTDRAVTLAHTKFGFHSEKFEHFSTVFTRHLWQGKRAAGLAALVDRYLDAGWTVYLRGHSNGCDVINRAVQLIRGGSVAGIQLIAAACDPDFDANGLNSALLTGRVSRVVLCCSSDDRALWAARLSYSLLNLFGNGYGCLGFRGPLNVRDSIEHRVDTHWHPGFDHGDWVSPDHLFATMTLLHSPLP